MQLSHRVELYCLSSLFRVPNHIQSHYVQLEFFESCAGLQYRKASCSFAANPSLRSADVRTLFILYFVLFGANGRHFFTWVTSFYFKCNARQSSCLFKLFSNFSAPNSRGETIAQRLRPDKTDYVAHLCANRILHDRRHTQFIPWHDFRVCVALIIYQTGETANFYREPYFTFVQALVVSLSACASCYGFRCRN